MSDRSTGKTSGRSKGSGVLIILAHLLIVNLSASNLAFSDTFKPKYGPGPSPKAVPLSLSNEFFRDKKNSAPNFWALISFYIPQFNPFSCSSASLTMVLNAAKSRLPKSASDKNLSEKELLNTVKVENWKQRLSTLGYRGQWGASLDQLGKISEAAFKQYGFPNVIVNVTHLNDTLPESKKILLDSLTQMKPGDFMIANFDQKAFTDDATVGHFAPVGAFDSQKERVLILDPDREYYEPYWVSVDTFLSGMATTDKSGKSNRGFILINTRSSLN